ncbi:hypothetical protein BOTBODRAFT_32417 [Botryobasidium botryosum FD-172 SS1]|uniref:Transmembrane protein n=1 Tax=Botryobasidium botryosum (strain FD-172 SS1) TaxID=930990 RepID=A0A067MFT0_BOTB1|nr:hypothetical protein BOTBODRAFT_32417 [Botryobasidium botryosum FD-172 SS1]
MSFAYERPSSYCCNERSEDGTSMVLVTSKPDPPRRPYSQGRFSPATSILRFSLVTLIAVLAFAIIAVPSVFLLVSLRHAASVLSIAFLNPSPILDT